MRTTATSTLLFFLSSTHAFSPSPKPNTPAAPVKAASLDESSRVAAAASVSAATPVLRKRWGIDKDYSNEYWFDSRIHTLGNTGFWGAVHAAMAPFSTMMIDLAAYNGVDVREKLAKELSAQVQTEKNRVVDLCCGVGFSTRALQKAFPEASITGVDTSAEMISMAEWITRHTRDAQQLFGQTAHHISDSYKAMRKKGYAMKSQTQFYRSNAEDTKLPAKSVDLVTVMYAFHEAPNHGRDKILREASRLLRTGGTLAVIDISTDYKPSQNMLLGEPYVQEYQKQIHSQLANCAGFEPATYKTVVPNHLGMWTLKRSFA